MIALIDNGMDLNHTGDFRGDGNCNDRNEAEALTGGLFYNPPSREVSPP